MRRKRARHAPPIALRTNSSGPLPRFTSTIAGRATVDDPNASDELTDEHEDVPEVLDATSARSFLQDDGATRVDAIARSFDVVETTTVDAHARDEETWNAPEATPTATRTSEVAEPTPTRTEPIVEPTPSAPVEVVEPTTNPVVASPVSAERVEPTAPLPSAIEPTPAPLASAVSSAPDLRADLFAAEVAPAREVTSNGVRVEPTEPVLLASKMPTMPPVGPLAFQPILQGVHDPTPTEALRTQVISQVSRRSSYRPWHYALLLVCAGVSAASLAYLLLR